MPSAAKVGIVSRGVHGGRFRANSLHKLRIQLLRDCVGYLGLDGKDIIQLAVVLVRPKMGVSACID